MPAIYNKRGNEILPVLAAYPDIGKVGVMVVDEGDKRRAWAGNGPKSLQVITGGFIGQRDCGILLAGFDVIDFVERDRRLFLNLARNEMFDKLALGAVS